MAITRNTDATVRLFTGLTVPPHVRDHLADMMDGLATRGLGDIRWQRPDNLHLTLNFIGDWPLGLEVHTLEAMQSVTRIFPAIRVGLGGLNIFRNEPPRPSVIYTGITQGLPGLGWLQAQLQGVLGVLETHPWVPHITLGQTEAEHDSEGLMGRLLEAILVHVPPQPGDTHLDGFEWDVEAVQLFRSERTDSGPVFTVVGEARLEG